MGAGALTARAASLMFANSPTEDAASRCTLEPGCAPRVVSRKPAEIVRRRDPVFGNVLDGSSTSAKRHAGVHVLSPKGRARTLSGSAQLQSCSVILHRAKRDFETRRIMRDPRKRRLALDACFAKRPCNQQV